MRRFQFSLRTLLIVVAILAVPCGWLGWQASMVRDRAEALESLESKSIFVTRVHEWGDLASNWEFYLEDDRLNWYRKLLGDHYVAEVSYVHATDAELKRITGAFPEARMTHSH